jgi:hypothetical protein
VTETEPELRERLRHRADRLDGLGVRVSPAYHRAAFFERKNAAGTHRYTARQEPDGTLELRVETDAGTREERHSAKGGPIYIGNQLDFLLHGLDLDAGGPWKMRVRVESGKIIPFEIRVVSRTAVLPLDDER